MKMFVTFKLNVKGIRKNIGYIVESNDIKEARTIAEVRARKEFSGIRSFTNCRIRVCEDSDKEFIEDITETLKTSSSELNNIKKDIISDKDKIIEKNKKVFLEALDKLNQTNGNKDLWRIVYTPGRKPRKRDFDSHYFIVNAANLDEAKLKAKANVERLGLEFKSKWCIPAKISVDELLNSERFKEYALSKELNTDNILDDLNNKLPKELESKPSKEINVSAPSGLKGFSVEANKQGFITDIAPLGLNIIEMNNLKEYKVMVGAILDEINFPIITVKAKNLEDCAFFLTQAIKKSSVSLTAYKDINKITFKTPEGKIILGELGIDDGVPAITLKGEI